MRSPCRTLLHVGSPLSNLLRHGFFLIVIKLSIIWPTSRAISLAFSLVSLCIYVAHDSSSVTYHLSPIISVDWMIHLNFVFHLKEMLSLMSTDLRPPKPPNPPDPPDSSFFPSLMTTNASSSFDDHSDHDKHLSYVPPPPRYALSPHLMTLLLWNVIRFGLSEWLWFFEISSINIPLLMVSYTFGSTILPFCGSIIVLVLFIAACVVFFTAVYS